MSHGSTPQRGQESDTHHHPHKMQHSTHYVDRDDSGHTSDRSGSWRGTERRRSRSPGASSHSGGSVPWADQRLPRTDTTPAAKPPATPKNASVKPLIPRPASTAATKRMATDITKWNRKHAELHATEDDANTLQPNAPASLPSTAAISDSAEAGPSSERINPAAEMSSEALARYDYKDLGRIACLLCQRKFKSADTLHRHESESQLHRDNLASTDTCREGVARKLEALANPTNPADNPSATAAASIAPTQYRDRASERRAVFGTEAPPPPSKPSGTGKAFDAPKTVGGEPVRSAPERRVGEENVGSKLLKMMGWTQGEGLGKGRQGTTEIVQTKLYRPGAGLGSGAPVSTEVRPVDAGSTANSRGSVTFQGYAHRARDRK